MIQMKLCVTTVHDSEVPLARRTDCLRSPQAPGGVVSIKAPGLLVKINAFTYCVCRGWSARGGRKATRHDWKPKEMVGEKKLLRIIGTQTWQRQPEVRLPNGEDFFCCRHESAASDCVSFRALQFDEYNIRDGEVLHAYGVPNGARPIDVLTATGIRDRKTVREREELRTAEQEKHRHFGAEYVRYIAHDYKDSFGGGTVLAVQNRLEDQDWGCCLDEQHLNGSQQREVRHLRQAYAARKRLEHRDAAVLENGHRRLRLEGQHQYHSSRHILALQGWPALPGS